MTRIKSWDYRIIGPGEIVKCARCQKPIKTIGIVIETSKFKQMYHAECAFDELIEKINNLLRSDREDGGETDDC